MTPRNCQQPIMHRICSNVALFQYRPRGKTGWRYVCKTCGERKFASEHQKRYYEVRLINAPAAA